MLIFTQPKSLKGSNKGSKNFFWVKICFKLCIIINRSQMYPSEKNTNHLTVRGGGRGGQPLRSAWPKNIRFFFWRLPLLGVFWHLGCTGAVLTSTHCFLKREFLGSLWIHFSNSSLKRKPSQLQKIMHIRCCKLWRKVVFGCCAKVEALTLGATKC